MTEGDKIYIVTVNKKKVAKVEALYFLTTKDQDNKTVIEAINEEGDTITWTKKYYHSEATAETMRDSHNDFFSRIHG